MQTWHIHIKGQVQGVGFRPFIFLLAQHILLFKDVLGLSWPSVPTAIVDAFAVSSIIALPAILVHRKVNSHMRDRRRVVPPSRCSHLLRVSSLSLLSLSLTRNRYYSHICVAFLQLLQCPRSVLFPFPELHEGQETINRKVSRTTKIIC